MEFFFARLFTGLLRTSQTHDIHEVIFDVVMVMMRVIRSFMLMYELRLGLLYKRYE